MPNVNIYEQSLAVAVKFPKDFFQNPVVSSMSCQYESNFWIFVTSISQAIMLEFFLSYDCFKLFFLLTANRLRMTRLPSY